MAAAPDTTTESVFDRCKPIDVDTHITEPPDVWTSRISKKWGDKVPHIQQRDGRDLWCIGDQMIGGPGFTTAAGFDALFENFCELCLPVCRGAWARVTIDRF